MYSVYGQVHYKKSIWGVVKSRIDKNCLLGMDDFFGDMQTTLQKELCTPPSKGKRSSRKSTFIFLQVNFVSIYVLLERSDTSPLSVQPSANQCNNNSEPQTISSKVSESIERSILIWLIFGVLVAVISLNSILLIKLWALERELSIESIPDYESLR